MKKKNIFPISLFILVLIGAFLRFYQLGNYPIALFGDEMDIGYHAYSLFKTGQDYLGNFLPIYFQSFGEFRMPLLVYLTSPIVGLFGLSAFSVRFLPAFFGVVNIFLFSLFIWEISKSELKTFLSGLILAILPWHIHFSRAGFDVTLMSTLLLLGFYGLVKSFKKPNFLMLSAVCFGLSTYAYSTATVFLGLMGLIALIIYSKNKFKYQSSTLFKSSIVLAVVLLPFLVSFLKGQSTERFSKINLFKDNKVIEQVITKRAQDNGGGRLFHNKLTAYTSALSQNYLSAFSPEFLFLNGDPNPRHSITGFGVLLMAFAPFLLLGLITLKDNFNLKNKLFLFWLLIAPIPASLTTTGKYHATRLFLMVFPVVYFIVLGIIFTFSKIRSKQIKIGLRFILVAITLFNFAEYWHHYYEHYPKNSWQYFSHGYKEIIQTISKHEKDYDRVVFVTYGPPHVTDLMFWLPLNPTWFHQNYNGQDYQEDIFNNFDGFNIGKYYFGNYDEEVNFLNQLKPTDLVVVKQMSAEVPGDWNWEQDSPENIKVLKTVTEPELNNNYLYLVTAENEKE